MWWLRFFPLDSIWIRFFIKNSISIFCPNIRSWRYKLLCTQRDRIRRDINSSTLGVIGLAAGVKPILWPAPIAGQSRAISWYCNRVTLAPKIEISILFDFPKKSCSIFPKNHDFNLYLDNRHITNAKFSQNKFSSFVKYQVVWWSGRRRTRWSLFQRSWKKRRKRQCCHPWRVTSTAFRIVSWRQETQIRVRLNFSS